MLILSSHLQKGCEYCGFRGSPCLGTTKVATGTTEATITSKSRSLNDGDKSKTFDGADIAQTYSALTSLIILGKQGQSCFCVFA